MSAISCNILPCVPVHSRDELSLKQVTYEGHKTFSSAHIALHFLPYLPAASLEASPLYTIWIVAIQSRHVRSTVWLRERPLNNSRMRRVYECVEAFHLCSSPGMPHERASISIVATSSSFFTMFEAQCKHHHRQVIVTAPRV